MRERMSDSELITTERNIDQNLSSFSEGLSNYLLSLNLPTDIILVSLNEKKKVITNLPLAIENLTDQQKQHAFYISKFAASCSVGLFDAALNYLWNETVLNLREKVIQFDLDFFFDTAISDPNKRVKFSSKDDLKGIADWELVEACYKIGIVSDTGYIHLRHIIQVRNHASAAHPNNATLTGFDLINMLEQCIIHVLSKPPSQATIEIKRLIINIKQNSFSPSDACEFIASFQSAPPDLIDSTLRTLFGMYTDTKVHANVTNNIKLIVRDIWNLSSEPIKYELGIKYGTFVINCEIGRKRLAYNFLEYVNGLDYLTEDQRVINIQHSIRELYSSHNEFNNFYNEESHVKRVLKFIGDRPVPDQVKEEMVRVILICRLGNDYGISHFAKPYYNQIISNFDDDQIGYFIQLLQDREIKSQIGSLTKAQIYVKIAQELFDKTSNEILKSAIKLIIESNITDIQKSEIIVRKLTGLIF